MKVFVTGASGWIGSATVDELLGAGHEVVGLARSDASAAAVEAKGAQVLRGDLDDLDSLRRGAGESDAVVHLANKHDFAHPEVSNRAERAAVELFAQELSGTGRPFLLASGVAGLAEGRPSVESDVSQAVGPDSMRGGAENLALDAVANGLHAVSVRFSPTTHGAGDHGFIALIADAARRAGVSGYVDDGEAGWAAVHVSDAARLVRLGVESAPAGTKLHAVGEESVRTRDIAEAIGAALGLPVASMSPEESVERIGPFVGRFFGVDLPSSSAWTQETFGWTPVGPTLVEDILAGGYGTR